MSDGPTGQMVPDAARRLVADQLRVHAQSLADETATRHLQAHPGLTDRFGPRATVRCREDGVFHIGHLTAALATDRPQLFDDHVIWLRELLAGYGLDGDDIGAHLSLLATVISETLGPDAGIAVGALITRGLAAGAPNVAAQVSYLDVGTPLGSLASEYLEVFAPVLREVGRLWQLGQATVGQEHLVTAATQLAMAQLYPRTFATPRIGRTIVVAAVGGELHEIGARMVADLFELGGWDSHFLGANTPTNAVIDIVGQIGADGTAGDARHAVARAAELVGAP